MLISALAEVAPRPRRVALGVFDGVHLGHQEVIRGCDTVLTFDRHPAAVVRPGPAPLLLSDEDHKLRKLQSLGVAEVVVLHFDDAFARQTPEGFVDDVLLHRLHTTHIQAGENFRFGAGAAGDVASLSCDLRFTTHVVPTMIAAGDVVSSSRIRSLVRAGRVEEAAVLLGEPLTQRASIRTVRVADDPATALTQLKFDPAAAVPGPASYACLVDGVLAVVRVGTRTARLVTSCPLPNSKVAAPSGVVEVQFLERLTAMRAVTSLPAL